MKRNALRHRHAMKRWQVIVRCVCIPLVWVFYAGIIFLFVYLRVSDSREADAYRNAERTLSVTATRSVVSEEYRRDADDRYRKYYNVIWEYQIDGKTYTYSETRLNSPGKTRTLSVYEGSDHRFHVWNGDGAGSAFSMAGMIVAGILFFLLFGFVTIVLRGISAPDPLPPPGQRSLL